jgi:hypothetical protein
MEQRLSERRSNRATAGWVPREAATVWGGANSKSGEAAGVQGDASALGWAGGRSCHGDRAAGPHGAALSSCRPTR